MARRRSVAAAFPDLDEAATVAIAPAPTNALPEPTVLQPPRPQRRNGPRPGRSSAAPVILISSSEEEDGDDIELDHRLISLLSDDGYVDDDDGDDDGHDGDLVEGGGTTGRLEPVNPCPICLEEMTVAAPETARLDGCLHAFHFLCVLQWSEYKRDCPLCKRTFDAILHNIRDGGTLFDRFVLDPPLLRSPTRDRPFPPGARRRDSDRDHRGWRHPGYAPAERDPRRRRGRHRGGGRDRVGADDAAGSAAALLSSAVPRSEADRLDRRRRVYSRGLHPVLTRGARNRTMRDLTPAAVAGNRPWLARIRAWVERDVRALWPDESDDQMSMVVDVVMALVERMDLRTDAASAELAPYFFENTAHFCAELLAFARTPFSVDHYDVVTHYPGLDGVNEHNVAAAAAAAVAVLGPDAAAHGDRDVWGLAEHQVAPSEESDDGEAGGRERRRRARRRATTGSGSRAPDSDVVLPAPDAVLDTRSPPLPPPVVAGRDSPSRDASRKRRRSHGRGDAAPLGSAISNNSSSSSSSSSSGEAGRRRDRSPRRRGSPGSRDRRGRRSRGKRRRHRRHHRHRKRRKRHHCGSTGDRGR